MSININKTNRSIKRKRTVDEANCDNETNDNETQILNDEEIETTTTTTMKKSNDNSKLDSKKKKSKLNELEEEEGKEDEKQKQQTNSDNEDDKKRRLKSEYFNQNCLDLSLSLLGKILVRRVLVGGESRLVKGKIVEVEAYLGADDPAAHSYQNKKTDRNKAMFMKPGTAYVYNIYGIYCCFNISAKEDGAAVLVRAVEPLDGFDIMKSNRTLSEKKQSSFKLKDLTSGPSRLCQAFNITKGLFNQVDLNTSNDLWVEDDDDDSDDSIKGTLTTTVASSSSPSSTTASTSTTTTIDINNNKNKFEIVYSKRINIDYAGEVACNKLYRFYIKNNQFVSVIDK